MHVPERLLGELRAIPHLTLKQNEPLAAYTRFAIGGPAELFCDSGDPDSFTRALQVVRRAAVPNLVIGGGTNLVISDSGFNGIVLRFTGDTLKQENGTIRAQAGALLQRVVDASIESGLRGMHTMTGIPGYLGGAVYGNAGAYGNSIHEVVRQVVFTDGKSTRTFTNAECEFHYRESLFKTHKEWVILEATLQFAPGDREAMREKAYEIRSVRDAKYPPDMKCAGSIFKNVFHAHLPAAVQSQVPPNVVRDGKIPSAWFLEQSGVKGMRRGDIQVADYHANLIYNRGNGLASDLVRVIEDCKTAVRERFAFELEEEVQYVGFSASRC